MNALVACRKNHSMSDEWNLVGTQRLVAACHEGPINWVAFDHNPDLLEFDGHQPTHRKRLHSNCFHHQSLVSFSLVVIAGGDVWQGGPLELLYGLLSKTQLPLFALGLQMPKNPVRLSNAELTCFMRHNSVLAVRDEETKFFVSRYDLEANVLAPPILFMNQGLESTESNRKPIGFVLSMKEDEKTNHQLISSLQELSKTHPIKILCPHVNDFLRFSTMFPDQVFYHHQPENYAKFFQEVNCLVTPDKLLGLAANSFGCYSLHVQSTREPTTQTRYPFVEEIEASIIEDRVSQLLRQNPKEEILAWKREQFRKYIGLLKPNLGTTLRNVA